MYNSLPDPKTRYVKTTTARDKLPSLIHWVQDPRHACVLTRHGKAVAALVSMTELKRIDAQHDTELITKHGHRPNVFTMGMDGKYATNREAAEAIQQIQLDRRVEREVLKKAGMEPVPGGELMAEDIAVVEEVDAPDDEPEGKRRRWWF